jgi:hypothetical protein
MKGKKTMIHVSYNFADFPDGGLLERGEEVHQAFLDYPTEVTGCGVTAAALDTANKDFSAKVGALAQGGTAATLARDASRATLIGLLRQIATWLENKAQGDASVITKFHFDYNDRGHHAPATLGKPVIKAILNEVTTQLKLRVIALANAYSYIVEYRTGGGAWTAGGTFTNSRGMVVAGLVPGTLYEFRVRAVGGNNQLSDWSDTVSHMCT